MIVFEFCGVLFVSVKFIKCCVLLNGLMFRFSIKVVNRSKVCFDGVFIVCVKIVFVNGVVVCDDDVNFFDVNSWVYIVFVCLFFLGLFNVVFVMFFNFVYVFTTAVFACGFVFSTLSTLYIKLSVVLLLCVKNFCIYILIMWLIKMCVVYFFVWLVSGVSFRTSYKMFSRIVGSVSRVSFEWTVFEFKKYYFVKMVFMMCINFDMVWLLVLCLISVFGGKCVRSGRSDGDEIFAAS